MLSSFIFTKYCSQFSTKKTTLKVCRGFPHCLQKNAGTEPEIMHKRSTFYLIHYKTIFSKSPHWLVVPPSLFFNRYQGSFWGVKRPERDAVHQSPPTAKAEKVELYLYSPYAFMVWTGNTSRFRSVQGDS